MATDGASPQSSGRSGGRGRGRGGRGKKKGPNKSKSDTTTTNNKTNNNNKNSTDNNNKSSSPSNKSSNGGGRGRGSRRNNKNTAGRGGNNKKKGTIASGAPSNKDKVDKPKVNDINDDSIEAKVKKMSDQVSCYSFWMDGDFSCNGSSLCISCAPLNHICTVCHTLTTIP